MRAFTPLESIAGFDASVRARLSEYWIGSAEELLGAARSSNKRYTSGRKALAPALGVTEARVGELLAAAQAALPGGVSFEVRPEQRYGLGLVIEGLPTIARSFDIPLELPARVAPLAALPPPISQGLRNTCVAFSLVALYQVLTKDPTALSAQFLYWAAKQKDGIAGDVGTLPTVAAQELENRGVCAEALWPYSSARNDANPGYDPPPDGAIEDALAHRIKGYGLLPPQGVLDVKIALSKGQAVLIGLPVREHWASWAAQVLGRVRRALPGEETWGNHAMAALGYQDDPTVPGGGYFIVRNSWGPGWGAENADGPGMAHVPYKLVMDDSFVALVLEEAHAEPALSLLEKLVDIPGSGAPDIAALYQEARKIKEQVDALLERLASMVRAVPSVGPASPDASSPSIQSVTPRNLQELDAAEASAFPLVLNHEPDPGQQKRLPVNGIDARTGRHLLEIDAAAAATLALERVESPELVKLDNRRVRFGKACLGTVHGVEANDLAQARWAVVVHRGEDAAVLRALMPLIQHRSQLQGIQLPEMTFRPGETCGEWLSRHASSPDAPWEKRLPVLLYRTGEIASEWLERHGASQGPVDPTRGVPFYLLLVGRPGPLRPQDEVYLPFSFQYELDIFWGVGRVCFTDLEGRHQLPDYAAFAERLVEIEKRPNPASRLRKEIAYLATRHEMDEATRRSADELVGPLVEWNESPWARSLGLSHRKVVGQEAGRSGLEGMFRGISGVPSAVLFLAAHGLGFPVDHADIVAQQGSLVCQDWPGVGNIERKHWLAAEDLGQDTKVEGSVAVLFACYGAGSPDLDDFVFTPGRPRPRIAPFPFIAQLPQKLLLHGALGVLGHVDRAWTYSFTGTFNAKAQTQAFQDVLARLVTGNRLGLATDQLNAVQGARASALADEVSRIRNDGKRVDSLRLSTLWMARNDARNYTLLGDPAARLPFVPQKAE